MQLFSAKTRVTFGLICLLVSVLLMAQFIGVFPDYRMAVMEGRIRLGESLALNGSALVSKGDVERLQAVLTAVVERDDALLGAQLRQLDGTVLVQAGAFPTSPLPANNVSSETLVRVPIRAGENEWGTIELLFRPILPGGLAQHPWARLICFVAAASFIFYSLYLGKVIEQLNPSKVVPQRVRAALDRLAEGLLITDDHGRVVFANAAFSVWTGKQADRLMGTVASRFAWKHGEPVDLEFPWERALATAAPQPGTRLTLIDRDAQAHVLVAYASPVLGPGGECRGVFTTFEDVTELEGQKVELRKAKQEVEDANRAKSEFLARMSHEIRTPMNAILGYADVLRRGMEANEQERYEYLTTIQKSGQHLLCLINDVLDLSKVESGRLDLDLTRCEPHQIVNEVLDVLRIRAEEKVLTLENATTEPIPQTILADPVRLRQIVTNLVGNAIKFTEKGGVKVAMRLVSDRNRSSRLAIAVMDTGMGIAAKDQVKIFDPFTQADASVARRFGGTGLGLSISRRFAQAMGGEIAVESEPGRGSVFTALIDTGPLDGIPMVDPQVATKRHSAPTAPGPLAQLNGVRILVVDDGDSNRQLLRLVLQRSGATVDLANDGRAGVQQALRNAYDLILMDMQMPVMDGYTATSRLRSEGCTIPIVALTADAMRGSEEKCRSAGCSDFLTKPIDIDVLLRRVAGILSGTPESQPEPKPADDASQPERQEVAPPSRSSEPAPVSARVVGRSSNVPSGESLISTLPLGDPEFLEIVREFVERLDSRLLDMLEAWRQRDLLQLAHLAHWLKGSGGTAGFNAFTAPARKLQQLAGDGEEAEIEQTILELYELRRRIVIPGDRPSPGTAELPCDNPSNAAV